MTRRLVAAVAVTGTLLTACSPSTPAPFRTNSPPRGELIAAKVIVNDPAFKAADAKRGRFVPCQGPPLCGKPSLQNGDYPGAVLPSGVDDEVDFTEEFVLYLVGADFDEATLDQATVHVRLTSRTDGLEIVKLDGADVIFIVNPEFSFEDENGRVICASSWEGCG